MGVDPLAIRHQAPGQPRPRAEARDGSVMVEWDSPQFVRFSFLALRTEREGGVSCEVHVRSTGGASLGELLSPSQLKVNGPRSRADLAKNLQERAPGRDLNWRVLTDLACQRALELYRAGSPAIAIGEAERPAISGYAVAPIMLASLPTVWFGDGGVGKSLLALAAAASLARGTAEPLGIAPARPMRTLYLDWEFDPWEHRQRLEALCPQGVPEVAYLRMEMPLRDQVERVRRAARDEEADLLVVDAVGGACGGDPQAPDVTLRFFEALRILGRGALCIAHLAKHDRDRTHPFGSVMWHTNARSTWYVELLSEEGQATQRVVLHNRKDVVGGRQLPVALEMAFERDEATGRLRRVALRRIEARDDPDVAARLPLALRIEGALVRRQQTIGELAESLGVSGESVRRTLLRHEGKRYCVAKRVDSGGRPTAIWAAMEFSKVGKRDVDNKSPGVFQPGDVPIKGESGKGEKPASGWGAGGAMVEAAERVFGETPPPSQPEPPGQFDPDEIPW